MRLIFITLKVSQHHGTHSPFLHNKMKSIITKEFHIQIELQFKRKISNCKTIKIISRHIDGTRDREI